MTDAGGGLKLIVNADDFGLSEAANEGIVHAHRNGIVTATSIMANGSAFEHAIDLARATPALDLGVHLTLVGEKPVLDPQTIPSLVGEDGRLLDSSRSFARRYMAGRIDRADVQRELTAQMEKVQQQRLPITHLDGHQHLHLFPRVFDVTVDLARTHQIDWIRIPNEPLKGYMFGAPAGWPRVLELLAVKHFCRRAVRRWPMRAAGFAGFYHGGRLNRRNLATVLRRLPAGGLCELMCHPSLDDPNSPYAHWGYAWADEVDALTDPQTRRYLQQNGVELTSYRRIADE